MFTLRNKTIKSKLISIIMAVCITALLLGSVTFIMWDWFVLREAMVSKLSTHAKIIADNCKAAVAFSDHEDATGVLQALRAEPSIVFGAVYTEAGGTFAIYHRADVDIHKVHQVKGQNKGHKFEGGFLTVYEPVMVDAEQSGTVCVKSDLSPLYSMLERDASIIFIMLSAITLLAYFMSSVLQRVISRPIVNLADVAKTVSEKKVYSLRAAKKSDDEIGMLIDAFNEMLEQINQRDLSLVNANEQLEKRVEERTSELREEVTVRKKAEEALAATVKKLTISNRELREFTRIAAHDLKTPVRGIGILSDWISEDYAQKSDKNGLENGRLLAVRAKRMNDLLDAIIQYSQLPLVNQKNDKLDLNVLIQNAFKELNPPDNVDIIIENDLPTIWGVRQLIRQIFENLLSNAIKHMDKPRGEVRVACSEYGDFWQFSITDNGPGIDKKYFEKIFEIFQILSIRDQTENIGIGLPIVKKIVEMCDGRIWVESANGEGSTFFFTLPKQEKEAVEYATAGLQDNIVS